MKSFDKKICFVTGGTKGIGLHITNNFNDHGYKVIALDIKQFNKLPDGVDFIKVDLKNEHEIISAFENIILKYGHIDILINNGAIAHFNKQISDTKISEFDDIINVNLRGSYICCKEFIKANCGQPYGRIINIASTRFHQNEANWECYGASKGGLVSLTSSLCVSLSDTPITVNAISPGWIQCDDYESLREQDHLQHPSRRVGKPKDIVNGCLFFADEENDFINGVNLIIDGGMTKKMIYD